MNIKGIIYENSFFLLSIVLFICLYYSQIGNFNIEEGSVGKKISGYIKIAGYVEIKEGYEEYECIYCEDTCYRILLKTHIGNDFNLEDKIHIEGELKTNGSIYYYSKGISFVSYFPKVIDLEKGSGILNQSSKIRRSIIRSIYKNLHGANASLLSGLLLGADVAYSEGLEKGFRLTSTSHIIAVSGFNINLIAELIMGLSIYIGRRKTMIFSIIFLLFYLFLVGTNNIPCLRAYIMFVLISIGKLLGRRVGMLRVWGISLIMILLLMPYSVYNVGLQLSFIASLVLIILNSVFKLIGDPKTMIRSILTTISCIIGTLPITKGFGSIFFEKSIMGNILTTPLIIYATLIGVIMIFLPNPVIVKLCAFVLELIIMIIDLSSKISL